MWGNTFMGHRGSISIVFVMAIIALACAVGWRGQGQVTRPGGAPRKWEYTTVAKVGKLNEDTLRPEMALLGVNGWELVTAYNDGGRTILFFKRPL